MARRSSLIETRSPHVGIGRAVRRGGYLPAVVVVVITLVGAATAPTLRRCICSAIAESQPGSMVSVSLFKNKTHGASVERTPKLR